ncbi:type IV pilus modification PilV family protein [Bdellovibrio sp. HCB209]|uniref:type IV pilus modification PilV family protein n=1 Tax=Bdellovibrio sp. HCB209 TaxID=3394354 RepID=UPI0039B3E27B
MKRAEYFKSQKGQSIVEALIALGMMSVIGFTFVGGLTSLRKLSTNSLLSSATDRQVADISENIKAGVQDYQINFNYSPEEVNEILKVSNLPMAWDVGRVAAKADCPTCGGTYGYIIQPYEKYRGLYLVTLRMTHKSWVGETHRDYNFVVSAK